MLVIFYFSYTKTLVELLKKKFSTEIHHELKINTARQTKYLSSIRDIDIPPFIRKYTLVFIKLDLVTHRTAYQKYADVEGEWKTKLFYDMRNHRNLRSVSFSNRNL